MRAAAVLLASLALTALACSGKDPEKKPPADLSLGMTRASESGLVTATLVAADPLPPLQGPNRWTVELRTSTGDPVLDEGEMGDVEVNAQIYMSEHDHRFDVAATMTEPGVFDIPEFPITMNGYWEVTVVVHPDGETTDDADESMVFGFLVEN